MSKVKCPNCKQILEADATSPRLNCPNCGKSYKNPFYNGQTPSAQPAPVAKSAPAAQPKPVAKPAPAAPVAAKPTPAPQPVAKQAPVVAENAPKEADKKKSKKVKTDVESKSEFTGGLGGLIGLSITNFLLVLFTLGFGTPLAICRSYRWEVEHKIIDGKKLVFDGKAGQLFGQWIKWVLLTIITIGIYGLWIPIKKEKWITSHTHLED